MAAKIEEENVQVNSSSMDSLLYENSRYNVIFTCHFNGFGVVMKSLEEMSLLYSIGYFGKGSTSRSKPKDVYQNEKPSIMRKRQLDIRNAWYKKFVLPLKRISGDTYLKDVNSVIQQILKDKRKQLNSNVIDLVSSDDGCDSSGEPLEREEDTNTVLIVPNSDSDEEADSDYFKNLKPMCCLNIIVNNECLMLTLQEAFFLAYSLLCLQIINDNKRLNIDECWQLFTATDKKFKERYIVYHYFRSKGYIVKPGIKFGADYVLYREGPGISHADFVIVIKYKNTEFDWVTILCLVRLATTIVKEIIIVEVIPPVEEVTMPQGLKNYTIKETKINRGLYKIDD